MTVPRKTKTNIAAAAAPPAPKNSASAWPPAHVEPKPLTPEDLKKLQSESAIPPDTAKMMGLFRVDDAKIVGFFWIKSGGIVFPYFDPMTKTVVGYRIKLDDPPFIKDADGKLKRMGKYLAAKGSQNRFYFPLGTTPEMLKDSKLPIIFVEGEKKAIAVWRAITEDGTKSPTHLVIGLAGVYGFNTKKDAPSPPNLGTPPDGLVEDFRNIEWKGRRATIVFDSNVSTNYHVRRAQDTLGRTLQRFGSEVFKTRLEQLPENKNYSGADDHIAARGAAKFLELLGKAKALDLPKINLPSLDIIDAARITVEILVNDNDPPLIFMHEGKPTCLLRDDYGNIVMQAFDKDWILLAMVNAVRYVKTVKDKATPGGWKEMPMIPPPALINLVLALLKQDRPYPTLKTVTQTPRFAPDGNLRTWSGYDEGTQTFYDPLPGFIVPNVSDSPSDEELTEATKRVEYLMKDFRFVDATDRAHALSLMLLPFVRALINGRTPIHVITKPQPRTGAGLLVSIISINATGREAAATTEPQTKEEWGKLMTAVLRDSPDFFFLDNVKNRVESAAFVATVTGVGRKDRELGKTQSLTVPTDCVFIVTGNNVRLGTEIAGRTAPIRMDAKMAHPQLRKDMTEKRLIEHVQARRSDYVWACLVIVKRWIAAGCPSAPDGVTRLGGYENWADTMGSILHLMGIKGFMRNIEQFYDTVDDEGDDWREFLQRWWDKYGDRWQLIADIYGVVEDLNLDPDDLKVGSGRDTDKARVAKLGRLLTRNLDRVASNGLRVRKWPKKIRHKKYQLERVESPDAGCDIDGPPVTIPGSPPPAGDDSNGPSASDGSRF